MHCGAIVYEVIGHTIAIENARGFFLRATMSAASAMLTH